ncbi:MAG: cytochrome c maturation protein CcmE [Anaerolineae bacterium]|jgi:cytochrome c-type biogenesis protein CcmE
MAGKAKFLVAGLLIIAAVAYLIVTSTSTTARYFLTIDELRAMGQDADGRRVTISGAVLGDTIDYEPSRPRVTFTIVQVPGDPKEVEHAGGLSRVLQDAVTNRAAPRIEVVYDDVKPDLLKHQSQAIIRGELEPDGRFHADEVLLKCPTKYSEGVPGQAEDL